MKATFHFFTFWAAVFAVAVICGADHYIWPTAIAGCIAFAAWLEWQDEKQTEKGKEGRRHE